MCIFPKPPKPSAPTPIPQRDDAADAAARELARRANAKGFSSTISPGSLLAGGAPQGQIATKTLLGG